MIVDELISEIRDAAKKRVAVDIRIGLKYAAVLLDDGGCGFAATLSHQLPCPLEYPGNFRNQGAGELINLVPCRSDLEEVLGELFTYNALELSFPDLMGVEMPVGVMKDYVCPVDAEYP